jgi:hypothetical protein
VVAVAMQAVFIFTYANIFDGIEINLWNTSDVFALQMVAVSWDFHGLIKTKYKNANHKLCKLNIKFYKDSYSNP